MKKIKDKIKEHQQMHEEMRREREEWIKNYRAKWEVNYWKHWNDNCSVKPWGPPSGVSYQPRRHWFFMKVLNIINIRM